MEVLDLEVFRQLLILNVLLKSVFVQVEQVLVQVRVGSQLESVQQLFLDIGVHQGNALCLLESLRVSSLGFLLHEMYFLFLLELQLSDPPNHLSELGQSLLALVDLERVGELQFLLDGLQRFVVVVAQLGFLPEFVGSVLSLHSLDAEVELSFALQHSRVVGVAERTGEFVAESSEVVFVGAEVLGFGSFYLT